jgi:hypothetical protein
MGVNIVRDDTVVYKLSTELVITAGTGNSNTITEGGNALIGEFDGQALFLVDTTDSYIYYKEKWYLI